MDGNSGLVSRWDNRMCQSTQGQSEITFQQGARLPDPNKLFNASLEGNQRRAIDFYEKDKINKRALKTLVVAAISYNRDASKKSKPKPKTGR